MAQRLMLINDQDESEGAETITYTVNGQDYEIDLSEKMPSGSTMCSAPTSKNAGAFSARPHQYHGEVIGAEVTEAAGMTSRKSAPVLKPTAMR